MNKYVEELMMDDEKPDNPPAEGYTNTEAATDYDENEMTPVGRDGRTEAQASQNVGLGVGADGKGVVSNNEPTDKSSATTAAMQPQQLETTAIETPIQPDQQIPATVPGTTAPAAAGTAPVAATGQVSLSGGNRQPYFYNQSGQFSSGNQSLQGLRALGELGLKPNTSTFQKAIAGVQRYEQGGGTMPLDKSGNFVQGWSPEDYNNLIDWTKVEGIGRPIDVSKKEDRDAVQNWLGSRFGAGLKGMHIDDKFGPYHVAAILEAAGQGDNNPQPGDGTPPPPERPNDPEEPTPDPYRDRYEEYLQKGLSPLLAYIGDEPKAIDTSRLRAIMSAHALGEGLRSIADVIHGPKGAPITEHKNNVTDWSIGKIDEAVRQFNSDKKEHRQMKLNALMTAMNAARQQSNADRQDWRQSIAQMYDRFDKKVDRQDKQYKDAWDRYNTDRQFRQQADQFAASLEQQGLNRKQAKELSIMQMNHQLQMQREGFEHQKQLQDEAIKAGKYSGNGTGGTGKNSSVHHYYHPSKNSDPSEVMEMSVDKGDGKATPTKVSLDMADGIIAQMQAAIASNSDRKLAMEYKRVLNTYGVEDVGSSKKLTVPQRQAIIRGYVNRFYDVNNDGWTLKGQSGASAAEDDDLLDQIDSTGTQPAPAQTTGNNKKLY